MWGRIIEIALGVWLMLSPWIFAHESGTRFLWWCDLLGGAVILSLAAACWKEDLRRLHLWHLAVGAFFVGSAFLVGTSPAPPAHQNHVVVGLLLMMMAIVPTHAARPPAPWLEFYEERRRASQSSSPTSSEETSHGTTR